MDLSPADISQIDEIVTYVEQRRVHQIALFLLEMLRPFSGSLAIVGEVFAPVFSLCFGRRFSQTIQSLLANRENIALLISRIEQSEDVLNSHREECRGR